MKLKHTVSVSAHVVALVCIEVVLGQASSPQQVVNCESRFATDPFFQNRFSDFFCGYHMDRCALNHPEGTIYNDCMATCNGCTRVPSAAPSSNAPSVAPTPSKAPTGMPTAIPSRDPSVMPTIAAPSDQPSSIPTAQPSAKPSSQPSAAPTYQPTADPTAKPSEVPSARPTTLPPSSTPSLGPTNRPTRFPTDSPSNIPTSQPTRGPSAAPSKPPSATPTQFAYGITVFYVAPPVDAVLGTIRNSSFGQAEIVTQTRNRVVLELSMLIGICNLRPSTQHLCGLDPDDMIASAGLGLGPSSLSVHVGFRRDAGLSLEHATGMARDINTNPIIALTTDPSGGTFRSVSAIGGSGITFAPNESPTAAPHVPTSAPTSTPTSLPSKEAPIQFDFYFNAAYESIYEVSSNVVAANEFEEAFSERLLEIAAGICAGLQTRQCNPPIDWIIVRPFPTQRGPNYVHAIVSFNIDSPDRMRSAEAELLVQQFQNGHIQIVIPPPSTLVLPHPCPTLINCSYVFITVPQVEWRRGTFIPTIAPSSPPTSRPTKVPSVPPTRTPSAIPSSTPSDMPSRPPTMAPTPQPTTLRPTLTPSVAPSTAPSINPSHEPSKEPSSMPSRAPVAPSITPTSAPASPTTAPSIPPATSHPTVFPSLSPAINPTTLIPTRLPSQMAVICTADMLSSGRLLLLLQVPLPVSDVLACEGQCVQRLSCDCFHLHASTCSIYTVRPTNQPSRVPTPTPSEVPSSEPSEYPSSVPSTKSPSFRPTSSPFVTPISFSVNNCGFLRTDCTNGDVEAFDPQFIRCIRTGIRNGICWCAPPFSCSDNASRFSCNPGARCVGSPPTIPTRRPTSIPTFSPTDPPFGPEPDAGILYGTVRVLTAIFNDTISAAMSSRTNFELALRGRVHIETQGNIPIEALLSLDISQTGASVQGTFIFSGEGSVQSVQRFTTFLSGMAMRFERKVYIAIVATVETRNLPRIPEPSVTPTTSVPTIFPVSVPTKLPTIHLTTASSDLGQDFSEKSDFGTDEILLTTVAVVLVLLSAAILVKKTRDSKSNRFTAELDESSTSPNQMTLQQLHSVVGSTEKARRTPASAISNPIYSPVYPEYSRFGGQQLISPRAQDLRIGPLSNSAFGPDSIPADSPWWRNSQS